MADVQKTVLTKFIADNSKYVDPVRKMGKELDVIDSKQKKIQKNSQDNGKVFKSSFGQIADDLGKVIPGLDGVARGLKGAEGAAKSFGTGAKAAIAGTGIGLLVIGVTELISKFSELSEKAPEDLSFVESKLVSLGNWFTDLLPKGTSFVNLILTGINPALGAMADAHDKARDARKKDNEEWDKAIKRLKDVAKFQEDFEKRVLEAEQKRQAALKKSREEREKEAKDRADQAAKNQQYWEEEEQREIQKSINDAQRFEEDTQRALAEEERRNQQTIQAQEDLEFELEANRIKKQIADEEKLRLEDQAAREEGIRVIREAGIDILQGMLLAQFAASKNEKKNAISTSIINTLAGIARIWNTPGNYWVKLAQSIALGALGAANTAKIAKQDFEKPPKFEEGGQIPAGGGVITGRRHKNGGVKFRAGGQLNEAEGGEFIVNRKATRKFLPQLHAINNTGLYADGGMIQGEISRTQFEIKDAVSRSRTVLVLEDFKRASDRLDVVENLSKL